MPHFDTRQRTSPELQIICGPSYHPVSPLDIGHGASPPRGSLSYATEKAQDFLGGRLDVAYAKARICHEYADGTYEETKVVAEMAGVEESQEKGRYPYLSFQTFMSLITKMQKEGIPARIDRRYLDYTSGINQSYLITALRGFGLIDEANHPEQALKDLVNKPNERKQQLKALIRKHYYKQIALPDNATAAMLEETFAPLTGATKRKAVTFFLHAAKETGMKLSPHFKAPRPARTSGPRKSTGRRRQGAGHQVSEEEPPVLSPAANAGHGMSRSLELQSGGKLTVSLSANIWDLSEEDEQFVMGLVKTMRSYGQRKSLPPGESGKNGEREGQI